MATAETVDLGPVHEPKEETIKVFKDIEHELKKELLHTRREYQSKNRAFVEGDLLVQQLMPNPAPEHEREYFQAVEELDDDQLAGFGSKDLVAVRVAISAYGVHLFGKIRIPAMSDSGPAYIHFRAFDVPGGDEPAKLHSIHTEEKEHSDGDKTYRAIFTKNDPLEWFDT